MIKGITHANGDDNFHQDQYAAIIALSHLSNILASVEEEKAFDVAAELAATLLRASQVVVVNRNPEGKLEAQGLNPQPIPIELVAEAINIGEETLNAGTPLLISNTATGSSEATRVLGKHGVSSVICVPMRIGDTNLGAIVCLFQEPHAFSQREVELLHVIASHTALATLKKPTSNDKSSTEKHTEELLALANRKIRELSLLNQISEVINSTLDLEKLLDLALEELLTAVNADGGSIMLINEDTGKLEIVASRGLPKELVETTSQEIGQSIAGWVAKHGESVLVTDARKDPRFNMPFYRDAIVSSASIPLKSRNGIIGVLNVNTVQPEQLFDERDLEFLQTVANQVAVALENARLYCRVLRRTEQLNGLLRVSRTVTSTLNLQERLRRLCKELNSSLGFDACTIFIVDEPTGRLRFGTSVGLKPSDGKSACYELASTIAAQVAHTGKKILLGNIGSKSSIVVNKKWQGIPFMSVLGLPLRSNRRTVAVATAFSRKPCTLTYSHEPMLRSMSELAGVAIHNALAYQQKYRIAALVQNRLLPGDAPKISGIDIGHKFFSVREVGGDYYDFVVLNETRLGIVVADVSGSNVDAAEHAAMGKYVLRAYAREFVSPAKVLSKANSLVCEITNSETFISAFYGVIDRENNQLWYANAGCEPALLYKPEDNSFHELYADGILLGITPSISYEERVVNFSPGDVLVAFTDGVTEAVRNGLRFGVTLVKKLLAESARLDAQMIAERIFIELMRFTQGKL
ncbi:MAG: GAF domain-containing protein, partial [Armatimonadota bacterium]